MQSSYIATEGEKQAVSTLTLLGDHETESPLLIHLTTHVAETTSVAYPEEKGCGPSYW
jgi:hypothetical protein